MTFRHSITRKPAIIAILLLQLIALVLFPPSVFDPTSQEWWLPVLLAVLVLVADFELIFRHNDVMWPWYLITFSQGFNLISRLMMVMPHASIYINGKPSFNTPYVALSIVSMVASTFVLWYMELPEVRMTMLRD